MPWAQEDLDKMLKQEKREIRQGETRGPFSSPEFSVCELVRVSFFSEFREWTSCVGFCNVSVLKMKSAQVQVVVVRVISQVAP
jgi:hypothetical protein